MVSEDLRPSQQEDMAEFLVDQEGWDQNQGSAFEGPLVPTLTNQIPPSKGPTS